MAPRSRRYRLHPDTVVLLRHFFVGISLFALVIAVGACIWYGTRIERLTIAEIAVTGGETVDAAQVRERVAASLAGTYAGFIPRRFVWFYPRDAVAAAVREAPRVNELRIERHGTTLKVTFTEHEPTALWCVSTTDTDSCLFLNQTGFAFAAAPNLQGGTFIRYQTLEQEPTTGVRPLPAADFATTQALAAALAGEQLPVQRIEIDGAGDAYFALAGNSELWISLSDDPQRVLENLATILESDEFDHLAPGDFQYIDLRFGNKVYVNDEPWPSENETTATATATSTATSSAAAGE